MLNITLFHVKYGGRFGVKNTFSSFRDMTPSSEKDARRSMLSYNVWIL